FFRLSGPDPKQRISFPEKRRSPLLSCIVSPLICDAVRPLPPSLWTNVSAPAGQSLRGFISHALTFSKVLKIPTESIHTVDESAGLEEEKRFQSRKRKEEIEESFAWTFSIPVYHFLATHRPISDLSVEM
ncbi:hypothetical protein GOODEAATRI_012152, partial [Goodea atripinnis]